MSEALLQVSELRAGYGRVEVLRGVTLDVLPGEIVALLGSNGAGKSTLNNTVCALLAAWDGEVRFGGEVLTRAHSRRVVQAGLIQVPEGRRIFPNLSVRENLELGAYARAHERKASNLERVFATFPRLAERERQRAGTMSGGEQQMLAIGRGLMAEPTLMLLDEPTLGLAPVVAAHIFDLVRTLAAAGITVLIAEQDVRRTLDLAQRGYVIENGRVAMAGEAAALAGDPRIREAYLGL